MKPLEEKLKEVDAFFDSLEKDYIQFKNTPVYSELHVQRRMMIQFVESVAKIKGIVSTI